MHAIKVRKGLVSMKVLTASSHLVIGYALEEGSVILKKRGTLTPNNGRQGKKIRFSPPPSAIMPTT
jgi:hypothetical protein